MADDNKIKAPFEQQFYLIAIRMKKRNANFIGDKIRLSFENLPARTYTSLLQSACRSRLQNATNVLTK